MTTAEEATTMPNTHRRHRALDARTACLVVVVLLTALTGTSPAAAAGDPPGTFSITPAPAADGTARPYFSLHLRPGSPTRESVIITNGTTHAQTLRLSAATGTTATNSGSAFTGAFGRCAESGCWISDLPSTVTLPAGTRRAITFTVRAPDGTTPGQYLAGVTAQPAAAPRRQVLRKNGKGSVGAVIIHQATVGVAVTIGRTASLPTRLAIGRVTATMLGDLPRLQIPVHNTGRTFSKSHGRVTCTTGGTTRIHRVASDTILPGDTATLPVNATALTPGEVARCSVRLSYRTGTAHWSGAISVPGIGHTTTAHPGNGVYTHVPDPGTPTWAIVLIVLGSLILVLLLGIIAVLARQRRRRAG